MTDTNIKQNITVTITQDDNVPESIILKQHYKSENHMRTFKPQSAIASVVSKSTSDNPMETPDNIDNIIQEAEEVNMVTTTFVDDNVKQYKDDSHNFHIDEVVDKISNPQNSTENIMDFLMKPIVLASGVFSTTDTFSIFNSYSMPFAALNSTPGLLWRQKLAGFFGIKMDMRFRLVVNANRFQQGRYLMGWTPTGGSSPNISNLKNLLWVQAHNATLVQRTTVPHVEIDLSSSSVAEMLIPFASSNIFYPLNAVLSSSDYGGLGYLSISPYSPLESPSGSTTCGYTLYVSFENVKLFGVSSAQAGFRPKRSLNDEISNKNQGPISGVASAISTAANALSFIPGIGTYASGVAWISDRVAKTASIFGYSKPTAGDNIPKMQIINNPGHSHVDGDNDCRALSFNAKPGTQPLLGISGIDLDEMDFNYIKMKYAWISTFSWSTSNAVGVLLKSYDISPITAQIPTIVGTETFYNYPPGAFLARQFQLWRGSIRMKFKIVKTEFHSGRISFAFFPTDESSYTNGDAYVNRIIVDVREKSEIEIILPYIARKPWSNFSDKIGVLRITVVDPLVAPDTVTPSISILTEFSCGVDFEVAVPQVNDFQTSVFVPQSGVSKMGALDIISTTIGSSTINEDDVIMSATTIGDKVTSLRAYLKRFTPYNLLTNDTITRNNNKVIQVNPDMLLGLGSVPPTTNSFSSDSISLWGSCFMFTSGGIRLKNCYDLGMTDLSQKSLHTPLTAFSVVTTPSITSFVSIPASLVNLSSQHTIIQDFSSNNTVIVEAPQYTKTFARNNLDIIVWQSTLYSSSNSYIADSTGSLSQVIFAAPNGLTVTAQAGFQFNNLYRAAADDFNFSLFISVPPMLYKIPIINATYY